MKAFVINLDSRPDRLATFRKNIFPFEVERFAAITATCGEDGCTQSHLAILSKQNEFPFVIFEDDCVMLESWSFVEKVITQLPSYWDALWLGANLKRRIFQYSKNSYVLKRAYGLHAVVYNSQRMVDFILNLHNTQPGENLDIFYNKHVQPRFHCYITNPIVATQLNDKSNISGIVTHNYNELIENYNKWVK